jgi:hypothetical protein
MKNTTLENMSSPSLPLPPAPYPLPLLPSPSTLLRYTQDSIFLSPCGKTPTCPIRPNLFVWSFGSPHSSHTVEGDFQGFF